MNVRASIIPENEKQRMAAVRRYDILDTPPDGAFDRITAIAARRFDVPISIISIVDEDRIWFKSHHGINARKSNANRVSAPPLFFRPIPICCRTPASILALSPTLWSPVKWACASMWACRCTPPTVSTWGPSA